MVSGPAGDALYRTLDGGRTWQQQEIALPDGDQVIFGLPWFDSDQTGWLPVLFVGEVGEKLVMFSSRDAGETWSLDRSSALKPDTYRDAFLGANAGILGAEMRSDLSRLGLPDGAYWVDFAGEQYGWTAVRSGDCQRQISPETNTSSKHCELRQMLLSTNDGGLTWNPVSDAYDKEIQR
jgi:hypothetical protein